MRGFHFVKRRNLDLEAGFYIDSARPMRHDLLHLSGTSSFPCCWTSLTEPLLSLFTEILKSRTVLHGEGSVKLMPCFCRQAVNLSTTPDTFESKVNSAGDEANVAKADWSGIVDTSRNTTDSSPRTFCHSNEKSWGESRSRGVIKLGTRILRERTSRRSSWAVESVRPERAA